MGKKNRSKKGQKAGLLGHLGSAIDAVARILKLSDEQNLSLETCFGRHAHSVSSCDGDGAYNIVSLFQINPAILPPGSPELSAITTCCIRCHDNIRITMFLPTDVLDTKTARESAFGFGYPKNSTDAYYRDFVEMRQNETGCEFRPAPYKQCAKLVSDCLLRMKGGGKVLNGKEERTVVRLYGLPSGTEMMMLPPPEPAPDVTTLWYTLIRPAYFFFSLNEDLHKIYKEGQEKRPITGGDLEKSLAFITADEYRRKRMLAMLDHMAMWHMLGNEQEAASWLLWERQSMLIHAVDDIASIELMKNNIIMQLMVNKFFDESSGTRLFLAFLQQGMYGHGMGSFIYYSQQLELTGNLPLGFIVTTTVAKDVGRSKSGEHDDTEKDVEGICCTIKSLKIKRTSCAVCGSTRSISGESLSLCSKCKSVTYCCQEHQRIHWKKGGHKQQCSK